MLDTDYYLLVYISRLGSRLASRTVDGLAECMSLPLKLLFKSDQKYNECGSIIVEYPKGREPSCNSKGEKYYGLMLKPVYGHPKSAWGSGGRKGRQGKDAKRPSPLSTEWDQHSC